MRPEAQQVINEIRSIKKLDDYVRIARTELASDPNNDVLRAFVLIVEKLVRAEKAKLLAYSWPKRSQPSRST